jgi:hypothetical protein
VWGVAAALPLSSGICLSVGLPACLIYRVYRVPELTAGLKVISIACTPDLRDWGTLLGHLGALMSMWFAG